MNNFTEFEKFIKVAANTNEILENVLLIKEQSPEATQVSTEEVWKREKIKIKPNQKPIKILGGDTFTGIFINGKMKTIPKNLIEVYDISQTDAERIKNEIKLDTKKVQEEFKKFLSKETNFQKKEFLYSIVDEILENKFNLKAKENTKIYEIYEQNEPTIERLEEKFIQPEAKNLKDLDRKSTILAPKLKDVMNKKLNEIKSTLFQMNEEIDELSKYFNLQKMDKGIFKLNQKNLEIENILKNLSLEFKNYEKSYNNILNFAGKDMLKADKIVEKMSLKGFEIFKDIETEEKLKEMISYCRKDYINLGKKLEQGFTGKLKEEFELMENLLNDFNMVRNMINEKEMVKTIELDKLPEIEL